MNRYYAVVAARAGHRCEYCLAPEVVFNFPFEVEHIVPPLAGGLETPANFALACRSCNLFKSAWTEALDTESQRTVRLYHPRRDVWEEHFVLNPGGIIVGLTEIGRATIDQLRMNAAQQVAARTVWRSLGLIG